MSRMSDRLTQSRDEFAELEKKISDPAVISSPNYVELAQRYAHLRDLIELGGQWERLQTSIAEEEELLESEEDLREELEEALAEDRSRVQELEQQMSTLFAPPDPNDQKTAIIEIRAGAGGDESGLFAGDLFRMYSRYAESKRMSVSLMDTHPTPLGGFKQVVFAVEGKGAYGLFRYESGVHRVQRVPETESQGRIHTSTATVVVLPEAEDVDIDVDPSDLKIDTYRSTGPGGQSVNTTDSAVRITHIPTGLVVTCQDEKSQHKNRAQALRVLRARLKDRYEQEEMARRSKTRRSQIGSGDRSEKIRTYNFPQNRITDHRIGFSMHDMEGVLSGGLDPLTQKLREAAAREAEDAATA